MPTPKFISWRGLQIPKITRGARIDIIAPRVPYYGHFVYKDGQTIVFRRGLIALSQIVLGPHYEAYPVNPKGGVLFESFDPVVIVAHCPLAILDSFSIPVHPNCPVSLDGPAKLSSHYVTPEDIEANFGIPEKYIDDIPEDPPSIIPDWDDPDYT